MKVLSGKEVRTHIIEEIRQKSQILIEKRNRRPGLAVILVGGNPASLTYVRNKKKLCEELGFVHFDYNLCEDSTTEDVLELVGQLNSDDRVDGILVQLPLPGHMDEMRIIDSISPEKDVDGFTAVNTGLLSQGRDCFIPCTPYGIMEILKYYGIETAGKRCTIIGRSNIVGKPMAMLLSRKGIDATVTLCNTRTRNLQEITLSSDIIIVATGCPGTLDSSMVSDGTVIIDVGMNRINDSNAKKGFRLSGDVDFSSFEGREVSITPVPGGVGVMTVAMLMKNTLDSALRREKIEVHT